MSHTADIKFQAYGKNFETALENSAIATFESICRGQNVLPKVHKKIKIIARTEEILLYDFLDEFLFIMDTESLILSGIKNLSVLYDKSDKITLSCDAYFDNVKNYDISGNIKSVTHSEMFIKKEKNKTTIQVVLDI